MASIREVAKLAGVSVGSVSRYLNGQQLKAANMTSIAQAIEELGYQENIIAKGLKNNRSFSVGLLMNSISSRFGAEVVSGIEEVMEVNGYSILLSGFQNDPSLVNKKLDYLVKHAVDGLILFVADQEWQGMERLADLDIPVVSINSPNQLANVDAILLNDRACVKAAVKRIAAAGHHKIGVIAAPQSDHVAYERLQGAYEAAAELPALQLEVFIGDYSRLSGYHGLSELWQRGITALFVSNFNMTFGVLEYMSQEQIRLGKDLFLSHYSYEDQLDLSVPGQLTIQQPTKELGQVCAKLLLERMGSGGQSTAAGRTIILENKIIGSADS